MGSGDLNLLKSWNPKLMKNRKKVWEAEQELLREQAKLNQRRNEIAKERELNRLVELSRERDKAADGDGDEISSKSGKRGAATLVASGLEWMYDDQFSRKSLRDEYLLGKKKLDPVALKLSSEQDTPEQTWASGNTTTTATMRTTDTTKIEHSSNTNNSQSKRGKTYDYSKDDPMSKAQQSFKRRSPGMYSERGVMATKSGMVTKPATKGSSTRTKNSRPFGHSNKFASMDY